MHKNIFLKKFCHHISGLVQDCSNAIPNALELLQSCTKPSTWLYLPRKHASN